MRQKFFKNVEFETQRGAEDEFALFSTPAGKNTSIWSKKKYGIMYAEKL